MARLRERGGPPTRSRVVPEAAHVLDASALLCLLFEEPGHERVEAALGSACIAAVNLAEAVGKLIDRGVPAGEAITDLHGIDLEVIGMDRAQAEAAGGLRAPPRGRPGYRSATAPAWRWPRASAPRP